LERRGFADSDVVSSVLLHSIEPEATAMHDFFAGLAYVTIVMAPFVVALTTWLRDPSCR